MDAPLPISHWVGQVGLGAICEFFVDWIGAAVDEGRAAETMVRFFGLGRLPEEQDEIGETIRRRPGEGVSVLTARRGLSSRQVQNFINVGLDALVACPRPAPLADADACAGPWVDPFPSLQGSASALQRRTLFWAWSQIPDSRRVAAHALLFYEYEHGLRSVSPMPRSRTERRRWRHQAWSLLEVARFRLARALGPARPDAEVIIERALGPRLVAVMDYTDLPRPVGGTAALAFLMMLPPRAVCVDVLVEVVEYARYLVRERLPEAAEVVGILRHCLARIREAKGYEAIPAEISSKVLALSSILLKEHRDVAGVAVAEAAVVQDRRSLGRLSVEEHRAARAIVVSDTLRTAQELAEMFDGFGMPAQAWSVLRTFREVLDSCGDPEAETEPDGWLHVLLLATASNERHLAGRSQRARRWLQSSADHASRAAELVLQSERLPVTWGLAALAERLNATLDLVEVAENSVSRRRLLACADRQVIDLATRWRSVPSTVGVEGQAANFAFHLSSWRAAALAGDIDAVCAARASSVAASGPWLLARDLDWVRDLERRSEELGLEPTATLWHQWPSVRDRLWVRPPQAHPSLDGTPSQSPQSTETGPKWPLVLAS
jgi:hypothetical protein